MGCSLWTSEIMLWIQSQIVDADCQRLKDASTAFRVLHASSKYNRIACSCPLKQMMLSELLLDPILIRYCDVVYAPTTSLLSM